MTVASLVKAIKAGELTSTKLVQDSLDKIDESKELNAYLQVNKTSSLSRAGEIDEMAKKGELTGPLAGVPIAVKDNIVDKEGVTTCASQILKDFQSVYDATVVQKLKNSGAVIVGKTNLDEFAMGTSTENSAFGNTLNPLDKEVIPGGSSGGSAVAVASGTVALALGSDTGGSIRQPAACCGIVGLKPSYGRVSRYGLVAFASSLDQIGPLAQNVEDVALLMNVISGPDPLDQTSSLAPLSDYTADLNKPVKGMTVGVPQEYFSEGLNPVIKKSIEDTLDKLKSEGVIVKQVSLPHMDYGVAAYYILATAEASANLSRYDGVRFTQRSSASDDIMSLFVKSRSENFGTEVKRRILLGTFVLSSGFYDAYYSQAQKVRRLITTDFQNAYKECDVLLTPTTPDFPEKLGNFKQDPLAAYMSDIYTVCVNLAGLPGLSLPVERFAKKCSNIQIIGKPFEEAKVLQMAAAIERLVV